MTARRMTSGELVKERQGLCITRGDEAVRPGSSRFTLTMPSMLRISISSPLMRALMTSKRVLTFPIGIAMAETMTPIVITSMPITLFS